MSKDLAGLSLRLAAAGLLFGVVAVALLLLGSAQSFLDGTLKGLFVFARLLTWVGLLASWTLVLPLCRRRLGRVVAAVLVGVGHGALFGVLLVWGSWIYPGLGLWAW